MRRPRVSVIIVHYKCSDLLANCLKSLSNVLYQNIEVIVVSNSPLDRELEGVRSRFPDFRYIFNSHNLGYAGGCNVGIKASGGKYLFILNNDVELDSDCITPMVEVFEDDPSVALAQPKILSLKEKEKFEYSGAAGGLMDVFGYPFARGRVFEVMEDDLGQYDEAVEVFWASGAALFARKDAVLKAGLFDAAFFAYMEEIDLCWRVRLLGGRVIALPRVRVYHLGSPDTGRETSFIYYLNHRNNLTMLLKNYSGKTLAWVLPVRFVMDAATLVLFPKRRIPIIKAWKDVTLNLFGILRERGKSKALRKVKDSEILAQMYKGSIAAQYFLMGRRKVTEMPGLHIDPYPRNGREVFPSSKPREAAEPLG